MTDTIFPETPEELSEAMEGITKEDIEINIEDNGRIVERNKNTKAYVGEASEQAKGLLIQDLIKRIEVLENR